MTLQRSFVLGFLLLVAVYLFGLDRTGLIGPDEPRYASIGRDMAQAGDWVVPRLWGEPWFEKPALLYWLVAAGHRLGLENEWAVRLPVAALSLLFLALFFSELRREFGDQTAGLATMILASMAGWAAYSFVAVTDLPLAATFSTAMLLSLGWLRSGGRRGLLLAGVFLGLAVLAKGLVPLVLALPLFWLARRELRALFGFSLLCVLVAAPWYVAITVRAGPEFLYEFFGRHHFGRFTSGELQHVRPVWFYLPVLAGLVMPWTPLLGLAIRHARMREEFADRRLQLLWLWPAWGLLFFSLSANKLPGYVLPLLPAIAVLLARSAGHRPAPPWVAACGGAVGLMACILPWLPPAVAQGAGRLLLGKQFWLLAAGSSAMAALLAAGCAKRWGSSTAVLAVSAGALLVYLTAKLWVFPQLDHTASARQLWLRSHPTCVEPGTNRAMRYGLNFYAGKALPACAD